MVWIIPLVYYTLIDINMSKIEDIAGIKVDEVLQKVHLGKLYVVD